MSSPAASDHGSVASPSKDGRPRLDRGGSGRKQPGSWIDRMHRQHHKSRHLNDPEAEPLMQEYQEEQQTDAEDAAPAPATRSCCQIPKLNPRQWPVKAKDGAKKAGKKTAEFFAHNWKYIVLAVVLSAVTVAASFGIARKSDSPNFRRRLTGGRRCERQGPRSRRTSLCPISSTPCRLGSARHWICNPATSGRDEQSYMRHPCLYFCFCENS